MNVFHFTLSADGSSDIVLLHHLKWLLRHHLDSSVAIEPQWADLRFVNKKPKNLTEKLEFVLHLYPCDILFVHRDAERAAPEDRYIEISSAIAKLKEIPQHVGVVPVRMTEAWLLFDEQAVRKASGNPNGQMDIQIPYSEVEKIPDPKVLLHDTLKTASGLSERRRKSFDVQQSMHRIAEYVDDFSPLLKVPAFAKLEKDIIDALTTCGWIGK
jgi:hypothetical protein